MSVHIPGLHAALLLAALATLATALAAGAALACGHCIEDQVAATYDYQVELRARRDGLHIAYLGISGRPGNAAILGQALRDVRGIAAGTQRVSAEPAAASFAWNARDTGLEDLVQALNERIAGHGLRVKVLRTWDADSGLH